MRKFLFAASVLLSVAVQGAAQTSEREDSMHVVLDEFTVTSIRAHEKSAVTYSEVTDEDMEKRNVGQDIPYLLSLTPSFVVTSDAGTGIGYTGYRVRGTDANRVNVTVNGVPLNDAESHGVFFVNMPDFASSLSSVQVQRGVGSSTNGAAAFGASLHMETEKLSPDAYAEISSSYGSFQTNKNMVKAGTGLIDKRWAFDARLSDIRSDGYIDRASVDMKSYYFSGAYYGASSTLKFITFGGNEKTYQAWNGVSMENLQHNRTYNEIGYYVDANGQDAFYDNQTDNYNQTHYQLHWLHQLNPDLNLQVTTHYTRGVGFYEDYKQDRKYSEYGLIPAVVEGDTLAKTDLIRQKWLDNHFGGFTWSLNYKQQNISATLGGGANRYDGNHFGKVIWVRNAQQLDAGDEWYRNKGVKDDANVYGKVAAEVFEDLFVNVDMQYRYIQYALDGRDDKYDESAGLMRDITQQHTFHFFNPKVGLTYNLNETQDLYASYSIANREPNRNNYTEGGPNEQPTSERLFDTEVGYRFQSPVLRVGANLFYMNYKNQLILTGKISEIGELLTTNIPDSYRRGIELMVGVQMTDWLKWNGNLSLSQHHILDFTEQDVDVYDADWNWLESRSNYLGKTNIAYSPGVVGNSMLTFQYDRFECGLISNFVGKQYIDNTADEVRSIPSYFINHLRAQYSLPLKNMKSVDFHLLVNNLFNKQYTSNGYVWYSYYMDGERQNDLRFFPQAGTHFLAGITCKF